MTNRVRISTRSQRSSGSGGRAIALRDLALVGLHVAGLLASSALLAAVWRRLPGPSASGIAEVWSSAQAARSSAHGAESLHGLDGLVLALRFALLPAVLEEALFRGLLYGLLRRIAGPAAAIGGGAFLFALAHRDPRHALVAGLLGLQLGLLRERHGLALAVLAHAANNALALALPTWTASGPADWLALLVVAGSSNAVLLQGLRSAGSRRDTGAAPASGDSNIGRRPKPDAVASPPDDPSRRSP